MTRRSHGDGRRISRSSVTGLRLTPPGRGARGGRAAVGAGVARGGRRAVGALEGLRRRRWSGGAEVLQSGSGSYGGGAASSGSSAGRAGAVGGSPGYSKSGAARAELGGGSRSKEAPPGTGQSFTSQGAARLPRSRRRGAVEHREAARLPRSRRMEQVDQPARQSVGATTTASNQAARQSTASKQASRQSTREQNQKTGKTTGSCPDDRQTIRNKTIRWGTTAAARTTTGCTKRRRPPSASPPAWHRLDDDAGAGQQQAQAPAAADAGRVNGITYAQCGSTWYSRSIRRPGTYQVVSRQGERHACEKTTASRILAPIGASGRRGDRTLAGVSSSSAVSGWH